MASITGLLAALKSITAAGVVWSTRTPLADGTPQVGTDIGVAHGDHRHPAVDASEVQKGVALLGAPGGAARFEVGEDCARLTREQTFLKRQWVTGDEPADCGYGQAALGGGVVWGGKLVRGFRLRADNGWSGTRAVLAYYDPKTGMQRHRIETVEYGIVVNDVLGPWHPFSEVMPALGGIVEPCGGVIPGESRTYRHISNALAYSSDEDNQSMAPRFLDPLVADTDIEDGRAYASVAVGANVGGTWFGSVLPVTFINRGVAPRKFAIQLHTPEGVPDGHMVNMNLGNIPDLETGFLWDLPQTFGSVEDVQPEGGTITLWIFLGLGRVENAESVEADRAPYTVQVDLWFQ